VTRLASTGAKTSLAARSELTVARLGEKNGERESERVPTQRMTMKLLGVWDAGRGAGKLSEAARQSSQPVRMEAGQGRAGRLAGRWPIPNGKVGKILGQSLVWRPVGGLS
jgi:hypothetical protein